MSTLTENDDIIQKREVPPIFAHILAADVKITKQFLKYGDKLSPLRSVKNHAQALGITCHGIAWLSVWMAFIFAFDNQNLYELQVNMLLALLLDIVLICFLKAFFRRRRPSPNPDMFTIGPDKFSFPSGHASRSTMIMFFFMYLYPVSFIFHPPLIAWVVSVCLSKVLSRKHYLLDILAGFACGFIEALFISLIWLNKNSSAVVLSLFSEPSIED